MLTVYEQEKAALRVYWEGADSQTRQPYRPAQEALGPLGNFILLLLSHLYDMKAFNLNLPHYF